MTRFLSLCVLVCALLVCTATDQGRAEDFDVTLECSADTYALGDSVFFTWWNGTDSTLVATYSPPQEIYDGVTGELMWDSPSPLEFHLPPHQFAHLDWDQIDHHGNPVPAGLYRVHIGFGFEEHLPPPPWFGIDDWFEILDVASVPNEGAAVSETSWGRIKQGHR